MFTSKTETFLWLISTVAQIVITTAYTVWKSLAIQRDVHAAPRLATLWQLLEHLKIIKQLLV